MKTPAKRTTVRASSPAGSRKEGITVCRLAFCGGGGFATTSTDRTGIMSAEMPEAAIA
jgi:hypothetical protein